MPGSNAPLRGLRRRPALAAALVYAGLAMLFLSPALLPGKTLSNSDTLWFEPPWVSSKPAELRLPSNPDLGDEPTFIQPVLRRAAEEMPGVQLWNPSIVSGRPFHGDFQSAVFSPYSFPAYVLGFWTALAWIGVLKLWVAAFGTYLLGRALGMRFAGALLAGVVFAFSLRMVTWLSYTVMGVWTWLPWLLLLTEVLVRRPGPLAGAGLAAVVAVQFFTGHPESSFHVLLATVAFFALRTWQSRRATPRPDRSRIARPLLAFAAAVAGGVALAAVTLLPFLELLWHSADLRDRAGTSVDQHLLTKDAIGLFLPDFWGRPTQTPIRRIMFESALYVGALPLMLAAAALALRPTATRVAVALFGGLWLAVVLGVPPFLQVVTRLPVFSSGHNTRLAIMTVLALALLAGWGLDDLIATRRVVGRRVRIVLAVSAALLVLPLLIVAVERPVGPGALPEALRIAWLFADPPGSFRDVRGADVIGLSSLIVWLSLAGAGLLLLVLRVRGRLGPGLFAGAALLLACVDLFRAGVGFNPAIEQEHASVPKTGAIRFLERQRPGRFVSTDEIPQNVIPMTFRLDEARGYDLPIIDRYDRLWRREVTPRVASVAAGFADIPLRFGEPTPRSLRTLRLLGVTHVLRAKVKLSDVPPFDDLVPYPPLSAPGLRLVYDGSDARVYRIQGALPRAWVAGAQTVVRGGEAALDAVSRPGFDARRTVVTERRLPGLGEGAAPRAAAATARVVSSADERIVVRARAAGEGVVVLNDVHFPGWKARVDGRDATLERVDYVLRGVRVGPGAHTVEFRYEPLSWRIGWIVTLVSLAGLALAGVAGVRGSRR